MHNNKLNEDDLVIINSFKSELNDIRYLIDYQKLDDVLKLIWTKISNSNKYIDEQAPWTLKNTNLDRMYVVIYCLIESFRQIAILIQPFIPNTSSKMLDTLSIKEEFRTFKNLNDRIEPNSVLNKPQQLFPRINA